MLQQRTMTGRAVVLHFLQCSPQALCVYSCRSCLQQQDGVALCSTVRQVALLQRNDCSHHPHGMPAAI